MVQAIWRKVKVIDNKPVGKLRIDAGPEWGELEIDAPSAKSGIKISVGQKIEVEEQGIAFFTARTLRSGKTWNLILPQK